MNPQVFAFGVNYKALNSKQRAQYSISLKNQFQLFESLPKHLVQSLVIMNTCNRTEIYGEGSLEAALKAYSITQGLDKENLKNIFIYNGSKAVEQIFRVASGLESQIIGDLEILGQFKSAFKLSKSQNRLTGFYERMANHAIYAAKQVRTQTQISTGTTSLSYAVIKKIKQLYCKKDCKILIVGMGDFGQSIAYNIADYLPHVSLSVCNRTNTKAIDISKKLGCNTYNFAQLQYAIQDHDIVVSAINTYNRYQITNTLISELSAPKIFIDMSVPFSIDPNITESQHTLLNIDDMSREVNETMESRKEEIPIASHIVETELNQFFTWVSNLEKSGPIHEWKNKIIETEQVCPVFKTMDPNHKKNIINKSIAQFATYVKQKPMLPEDPEVLISEYLQDKSKGAARTQ